jgi:hypothetical protein
MSGGVIMKRVNSSAAPKPHIVKPWIDGEPRLDDVLADPIVHTLMAADGLQLNDLCDLIGHQYAIRDCATVE